MWAESICILANMYVFVSLVCRTTPAEKLTQIMQHIHRVCLFTHLRVKTTRGQDE